MGKYYLDSDILEIIESLGDVSESFRDKTILITGGCGFLGRYFTAFFMELKKTIPCRLILLDNFITSQAEKDVPAESDSFKFIKHDIIQPLDIDEKIDFIVHAAGIASPYYYRAHPLETLDVSIIGTRRMLDLAHRDNARFVFFSSSEIYGDPDPKHVPTPESYRGYVTCQGPRACYDESKRVGETLCYIYHETHGTKTNTIRPFNIYGPGMDEKDFRVLPNFASRIKGDLPLRVYGTGDQTRTFCYVTDAIDGFIRIMVKGTPGNAYNIGNPKPEISILDLVKITKDVVGKSVTSDIIEYPDSYPSDEPMRRCPDIRKAQLQLNYEPKVSLAEGLNRFYTWADGCYSGSQ